MTVLFIPYSGRKHSHTYSYNFAMAIISQDDHLITTFHMMEICRQNYVMTTIGYERERNLINKDGFDSKKQTRSPQGGLIEKQ